MLLPVLQVANTRNRVAYSSNLWSLTATEGEPRLLLSQRRLAFLYARPEVRSRVGAIGSYIQKNLALQRGYRLHELGRTSCTLYPEFLYASLSIFHRRKNVTDGPCVFLRSKLILYPSTTSYGMVEERKRHWSTKTDPFPQEPRVH